LSVLEIIGQSKLTQQSLASDNDSRLTDELAHGYVDGPWIDCEADAAQHVEARIELHTQQPACACTSERQCQPNIYTAPFEQHEETLPPWLQLQTTQQPLLGCDEW